MTTHIVGDHAGWNLPSCQEFYEDWAKKRTFAIGDILLFKYNPGLNTVVQVNKEDYECCTTKNTIHTYFDGNTAFTLDKAGEYFFYSSVGRHCEAGLKLRVTVPQGKHPSH
ncbi:Phytocyanin domain [Sesbania bispinosa]|nr:Phytocyanin domain [Sesbania bispinosa]